MACQTLAKVLRRSVGHPDAPPITSFQLRYPRIIHAESKTHRVLSETEFEPETPGLMNDPSLSRNARSSRAVPVPRLIEEVMTDPFIPRYWGKNQKGMQASEEIDPSIEFSVASPTLCCDHHMSDVDPRLLADAKSLSAIAKKDWVQYMGEEEYSDQGYKPFISGILYQHCYGTAEDNWLIARDRAVEIALAFHNAGYHKQIVNRLIEPFMHIDVVVTGTQFDNFFALRDHEMAEPHIRDLARAMKEAMAAYGDPDQLQPGEWHAPYVDELTLDDEMQAVKVSVTRCAQVSYTPFHEAKLSIAEEVARHDQLVSARPMHASPAEHQATPDTLLPDGSWANPHLAGNLGPGWIQYRKTLAGERA